MDHPQYSSFSSEDQLPSLSEEDVMNESEEEQPEEDVVQEQQSSMSRARAPRAITKWPEDVVHVTSLNGQGLPNAPPVAVKRFRRVCGLVAREDVSLVMDDWKKLSDDEKKAMYDHLTQYVVIPEEWEELAKWRALKVMNKAWNTFKTELLAKYVDKNRRPAKYRFITDQKWEAFLKKVNTKEYKAKREALKKIREQNRHNHHLGAGGYDGRWPEWEKEDADLLAAGRPNPYHIFPEGRCRNWVRARTRLSTTGEIIYLNAADKEVSTRMVHISQEASEGNFQPRREKDILSEALGAPEHPGRVRAVDSYAGWIHGFPEDRDMYKKRSKSSRQQSVDVEEIENLKGNFRESMRAELKELREELKEELRKELKEELRKELLEEIQSEELAQMYKHPSRHVQPIIPCGGSPPGLKRSCASTHASVKGASILIDEIKVVAPCALMVPGSPSPIEVARGTINPNRQQEVIHTIPPTKGYVVVQVESVVPLHRDKRLDIPVGDEITTVGEALQSWIQWKKEYVVLNPLCYSPTMSSGHKEKENETVEPTSKIEAPRQCTSEIAPPNRGPSHQVTAASKSHPQIVAEGGKSPSKKGEPSMYPSKKHPPSRSPPLKYPNLNSSRDSEKRATTSRTKNYQGGEKESNKDGDKEPSRGGKKRRGGCSSSEAGASSGSVKPTRASKKKKQMTKVEQDYAMRGFEYGKPILDNEKLATEGKVQA